MASEMRVMIWGLRTVRTWLEIVSDWYWLELEKEASASCLSAVLTAEVIWGWRAVMICET